MLFYHSLSSPLPVLVSILLLVLLSVVFIAALILDNILLPTYCFKQHFTPEIKISKDELPRLYRRVDCLSQAALSDSLRLSGGVLKSRLALKVNRKSMLSSLALYGFQSLKNCSNFNQPTF